MTSPGNQKPRNSGTRDKILVLIRGRESETVNGLSDELGLAPATIRRHLDILQRDGLVTFTEIRHGTGRPEFSFSLTDQGHESLPKHYNEMLGLLVSRLTALDVESLNGRAGKQLFDEILGDLARESVEQSAATGAGVARLVEMLREQDFAPEVSADTDGISISLMSCPFRSVAMLNPELCGYDTAVIARVAASPVKRVACLTDGDPFCRYVIAEKPATGGAKH
ncbi:MAG: ArsR family transcriptional regulator [Chloroflexi bacterium]|nr:ArsR family transcriptional regulator [Chloroflexota bacterium]